MRARGPSRLAAVILSLLTSLVAGLGSSQPALADYAHIVARGETLTSVATEDGVTVAALAAANGISPTAELLAGATLEIPPRTGVPGATEAGQTSTSMTAGTTSTTATAGAVAPIAGVYVVQLGDTLTAIAERDGTTVAALAATNGLDPNRTLLAGVTLRLPGVSAEPTGTPAGVPTSEATSAASSGGTTAGSAAPPPYPTHEFVTAPQVAQIAAANGVPAALAEAVGWQESGFDNDEVSSAGAVGVMQITPSTWSWINRALTDGATLAPASAASNVMGGVLLLRSLLARTGSESEAAAGYYQGLASIERFGQYASTQQYVSDVLALAGRFGG